MSRSFIHSIELADYTRLMAVANFSEAATGFGAFGDFFVVIFFEDELLIIDFLVTAMKFLP